MAFGLSDQRIQRRQGLCAQLDHPAHNVHTVNHFGYTVLHLQTGVHLQEPELLRHIVINIFHGACAAVVHGLTQTDCGGVKRLAVSVRKARRRRFFDHFLVTALRGTIALAECDDIAVAIAEDLDFNMARPGDKFL